MTEKLANTRIPTISSIQIPGIVPDRPPTRLRRSSSRPSFSLCLRAAGSLC